MGKKSRLKAQRKQAKIEEISKMRLASKNSLLFDDLLWLHNHKHDIPMSPSYIVPFTPENLSGYIPVVTEGFPSGVFSKPIEFSDKSETYCVPPFPCTFFEFHSKPEPLDWLSKAKGVIEFAICAAVHMETNESDDEVLHAMKAVFYSGYRKVDGWHIKFYTTMMDWGAKHNGSFIGHTMSNALEDQPDVFDKFLKCMGWSQKEEFEGAHHAASELLYCLYLLSVKGSFELIDRIPDATESLTRRNVRGIPLVKYKELKYKPMGKHYPQNAEPKEYQGLMPLHLRRGHPATYTEAAPLFGKYVGTFFRPATVVGEKKNGVVVKDYKVMPPKQDTA